MKIFVAIIAGLVATSTAAQTANLSGENTRYCEAIGLNADSFVPDGSAIVGLYEGKWAGQDSSTIAITKVEGVKVIGFYAYGPQEYCEEFSGTMSSDTKVNFTLSWGATVVLDFAGEFGSFEKPHGTYRNRGHQAYGDFPRLFTPIP